MCTDKNCCSCVDSADCDDWRPNKAVKKLTKEYKFVSRDAMDTCANYARLTSTGDVEVKTLYRHGAPYASVWAARKFKRLYPNWSL